MENKNYKEGLAYGILSYTLWGFLPLYWRLVGALSPYQIFAQRVVWSFVFLVVIMQIKRIWSDFIKVATRPRLLKEFLAPAIFISINWIVYIWSVNSGYVIEVSLGYYMNPLVLTLIGSIVYKERLSKLQFIGMCLASLGVIYKTLTYGRIPVIALILATSFSFYGLLKKKSRVGSVLGLAFETVIIGIPALIYLILMESSKNGITGNLPASFWLLIMASGIATATPLLFYAESAKRLPLTVLGFLQYISPTISLILGIFVFKESFDFKSLIAFSLIWIGLLFFTYSQYLLLRNYKRAARTD